MDLGALRANHRGYEYWKALTTGKSPRLGGIPHDTYGMTTTSVHQMVLGLLRETKTPEESVTKFQTGGPDGDLGSNEILMSKDKTIGIVDGSGVLYDPVGLDRGELTRLAKNRIMCENFDRQKLGPKGFLVKINEKNVTLPDGTTVESGLALRDTFHLSNYACADLLVPCGGRPGAVNASNVHELFVAGKCKFKYIVEGANLFITQGARDILEEAGVHLIRDASANKGGVTSSSLEVLAALALPEDLHDQHMCVKPGQPVPDFYAKYVEHIVSHVKGFADKEFQVIWDENQARGVNKTAMTTVVSQKINLITDTGLANLQADTPLFRFIMSQAIPKLLLDAVGLEACLERLPPAYQKSLAAVWLAGTYVYSKGVQVSDFDFYAFMQSLHAKL
jgi:glutamate dehydrogenase